MHRLYFLSLVYIFSLLVLNTQFIAQQSQRNKMNEVTITFLRHGESQSNIDQAERTSKGQVEIIGGHNLETPLTRKGQEQAKEVGYYFAKEGVKFSAVYASTAIRAHETALLCLQAMNNQTEIRLDAGLLEWGRGDWEGKPRDIYEDALNASGQTKWGFVPGGEKKGESQEMVSQRMQDWAKRIVQEYSQNEENQHILAVTHGGAMKFFLQGFIGNTHEGIIEMATPSNTDMTRLIFRNGTLAEVQIKNNEDEFKTVRVKSH